VIVTKQAAIYGRVSSEQQAEANTIASQLAALRERVSGDGLSLADELEFIDEGYSGASLVRPELERLRDCAASGLIDRLYVHSPDRLARNYAYQVLLVDELKRTGVEIVFLNRALGSTPEDDLLLQVQGMMAEYERAKIIERHRRGKLHAARTGSINVLVCAPYGYAYIAKHDGGGQARLEIIPDQARVVRQVFHWVGREGVSIGEVCRRLASAGEQTRKGKLSWDRTAVWGMLKNPTYKGTAAFGKTRNGPVRPRLRVQRGCSSQPRRGYSCYDVPADEWIMIPVPAIVDSDLWETVQDQLRENQRRARTRLRGARYLLQGLIACQQCGYTFYGKAVSNKAAKGYPRSYAYYRCVGTDAYRFGGQRVCNNTQVRTDKLDLAVWQKVKSLLECPDYLAEEYSRRLKEASNADEVSVFQTQLTKLRRGVDRLIDSYAAGFIDKGEFEPRVARLKDRVAQLEQQAQQAYDEAKMRSDLRLIIGQLEDFTSKVKGSLESAEWTTKRDIIRALVKIVQVGKGAVTIVFKVNPPPFEPRPERGVLQHCWRRSVAVDGQRLPALRV
jgi:site-specific DNA recombinase